MPEPLAGAVMSTFLAPASMCLPAPASSMNTPVPSMTRSISMSFQGSLVGSREDTTLMGLPLMEKESSPVICGEGGRGAGRTAIRLMVSWQAMLRCCNVK
jgi:hypothetical protein